MDRFKTKFQLLLAKIEETYGSDVSPSASSNAKEVMNLRVNLNAEPDEQDVHRTTLSQDPPIPGKRFAEISFDVRLKGSGTAGTAPALGDFLKACAFSENIGADGGSSSVAYLPSSVDHASLTIYRYRIMDNSDAILEKFVGSRGNPELIFAAGRIVLIRFTFKAAIAAIAADVSTPTPTWGETTKPPILQAASFALNSVALRAQSMNINMNNEVVEDEDFNGSIAGLNGFIITGRKPDGQFNPDIVQVSSYDFHTDWKDVNERDMTITVGETAGNKFVITAPKVSLDQLSDEDLNGKAKLSIPFRLNRNSGDDELSIIQY